jgi:hypothetical protein
MILLKKKYLLANILWDSQQQFCIFHVLTLGVYIRQADIASAAGITEATLRNRIKDLKDKLPQLNN